jgi:transcriptional regulator with XRE-family HTH domain
MKIFSERLKELRVQKGLSQREMAKIFNISQVSYCKWEQGKTQTDFETLAKLCDFFDVSADYLLGRADF